MVFQPTVPFAIASSAIGLLKDIWAILNAVREEAVKKTLRSDARASFAELLLQIPVQQPAGLHERSSVRRYRRA